MTIRNIKIINLQACIQHVEEVHIEKKQLNKSV